MAYYGTFASGQILTAAELNGSWTTFTPTWTNLTVGNGTQNASCIYLPGMMMVRGTLTFGTTTTIAGSVSQTVPNGETLSSGGSGLGPLFASNGTNEYAGIVRVSATTATFFVNDNNLTATNPFTWASTHVLAWNYMVPL